MTKPANFVWYDVMTDDVPAAEAFYKSVVGWTTKDVSTPDVSYTLFCAGEAMVGGLMPIPAEARAAGVKPAWMGYVGVADVDDAAKRVEAAGGAIHRAPCDIPDVGRFAVVSDPDGAGFILFAPKPGPTPVAAPSGTPGHFGWRELFAGDGERAFAFYSQLFGWTKAHAVDMGAMGTYQLFAAGGEPVGGMMTAPPGAPPHWGYTINVEAIDAATARVERAGGAILNGPHQVPTGYWVVQCRDNRGVYLEVVANEKLVFTNAYSSAWVPSEKPFMTVVVTFEDEGAGTRYVARALHWTREDRDVHEKMGFHTGWAQCARQLEAVAAGL